MPEIKRAVRPVRIDYACDDCYGKPHAGCLLTRTEKLVFTDPVQFEYACPNCKKIVTLKTRYPDIEFLDDPNYWE